MYEWRHVGVVYVYGVEVGTLYMYRDLVCNCKLPCACDSNWIILWTENCWVYVGLRRRRGWGRGCLDVGCIYPNLENWSVDRFNYIYIFLIFWRQLELQAPASHCMFFRSCVPKLGVWEDSTTFFDAACLNFQSYPSVSVWSISAPDALVCNADIAQHTPTTCIHPNILPFLASDTSLLPFIYSSPSPSSSSSSSS